MTREGEIPSLPPCRERVPLMVKIDGQIYEFHKSESSLPYLVFQHLSTLCLSPRALGIISGSLVGGVTFLVQKSKIEKNIFNFPIDSGVGRKTGVVFRAFWEMIKSTYLSLSLSLSLYLSLSTYNFFFAREKIAAIFVGDFPGAWGMWCFSCNFQKIRGRIVSFDPQDMVRGPRACTNTQKRQNWSQKRPPRTLWHCFPHRQNGVFD
jgi:hypothetical protein